uniref:Ig-like domain-containing protein n=1 Tax=Esox lucius TaxID=8010 RepID=A0AAY5L7K3_ESOLU
MFTSAPVLAHPDPSLLFIVEVDASEVGIGAVLSQLSGTPPKCRPCSFYLRKLSEAEHNYGTSKTVRYIIPIIKTGQTGLYRCEGMRTERPQRSQPSNDLSISVPGKFTIKSLIYQKDILTGDSVTLTCTESSGWRFYWYRHRQDSEPVATTSGSSYTLSQVSVSDGGQYRCRAGRGDPVYYTQYSEPVHIQVTGESNIFYIIITILTSKCYGWLCNRRVGLVWDSLEYTLFP